MSDPTLPLTGRPPLQGGLPPVVGAGPSVVEIACDESGFSGSNLLDAATPVFAHASVDVTAEEAAGLVAELRSGFRWSLNELKSGQLLRGPRADEALAWLLGQLAGHANVQLVDKEYFLVTRIVDLFLAEPSYAAGTRLTQELRPAALALYRARRVEPTEWSLFLEAFVELVRTKRRRQPDRAVVKGFFRARDALASVRLGPAADEVLNALSRTRVRAVATRLAHDDRSIPPPLEPLLPALAETVLFWSGGHRQVLVVHDEQSALTAARLVRLQEVLTGGPGGSPSQANGSPVLPADVSPLAGLVTVDSRDDPRVQVADLLAGVARRSPGNGDDGILAPFISPTSLRDPGSSRNTPSRRKV